MKAHCGLVLMATSGETDNKVVKADNEPPPGGAERIYHHQPPPPPPPPPPPSSRANGRDSTATPATKRSRKNGDPARGELKFEWKDRDVIVRQVTFDESTMPPPVCSCTGTPQRCYKWGQGGWQSSCCTPTMSMYPLPFLPVKRHGRIGGRKMSGGAFTKLLSRAAAEGHDLSTPLNLKDHWAKHGTNGWITIK